MPKNKRIDIDQKLTIRCNFFGFYLLASMANPFPSAIKAIPNSNSEIPVAKKDVAQPAYTASPNPFRQTTNPKAIAIKPK
jgi:hypothetical protein